MGFVHYHKGLDAIFEFNGVLGLSFLQQGGLTHLEFVSEGTDLIQRSHIAVHAECT